MDAADRVRLLEAMLIELGKFGREAIDLPRVLRHSRVSAADFAAKYSDLDACLADAFREFSTRLDAVARRGCEIDDDRSIDEGRRWPERVWGGLQALLIELSSRPELARALACTFPSLGLAEQAGYQGFVEGFVPLLARGREFPGAEQDLPAEVEMLAVGAAEAIIFAEIASGRAAELPAMGPSILFSLLVPFLGSGSAAAEMERAGRSS